MRSLLIAACISLMLQPCFAFDRFYTKVIDLNIKWQFTNTDKPEYAQKDYYDSSWDKINVPGPWELFGYPNYDGYGWYRMHVFIPSDLRGKYLYFHFERGDDVDFTYWNGKPLQSRGEFPPRYDTAFDQPRWYPIPESFIRFGEKNVIAVRMYDAVGEGGICGGNVGIWERKIPKILLDLSGQWRFKKGTRTVYADENLNDSGWSKILVPANWESQGSEGYDGHAWYRKDFRLDRNLKGEQLILMLGKIDDYDEVFLNGVHIGGHGLANHQKATNATGTYFDVERYYYIPKHLLHWNKDNVLSVHVQDFQKTGGIYDGPVGILSQKDWLDYMNMINASKNYLEE